MRGFWRCQCRVRVKEGLPKRSEAQRDTDSVAASQKEAPGWMSQSLTNVFTIALNATQDARGQSADGSTKPELGNRVRVRVCDRRCAYSAR